MTLPLRQLSFRKVSAWLTAADASRFRSRIRLGISPHEHRHPVSRSRSAAFGRNAEAQGRLLANQPLAALTWFRVGGPAQLLFTPADEEDLAYFLAKLPSGIPVSTVGVGSNLIVRDGGVEGVVIRLSPKGFGAVENAGGGHLQAGAAVLDKRLAEAALQHGVGGLEFFFGIPGSIGGALRMNAGANGGETKDVLVYANGVTRDGDFVTFSNEEMGFSYRSCAVDTSVIFTSALFKGRGRRRR